MTEGRWADDERAAVIREGEAILSHSSFRGSKRCVSLLGTLIEHAVNGESDLTKERLLGIEVFGRKPDYDTNLDPVVRMTANEIRKRLAQFYQETERHSGVKIRLIPGTYLLQVEFATKPEAEQPHAVVRRPESPTTLFDMTAEAEAAATVLTEGDGGGSGRRAMWLASAALLGLSLAGYLIWSYLGRGGIWQPLLSSNETIRLCVAAYDPGKTSLNWAENAHREILTHEFPRESLGDFGRPVVAYVDVRVAVGISGWLAGHGKQVELQRDTVLSLEELRRGPAILIGAFNNHWSLVLLSGLRYHVQVDPATKEEWIEDSKNPNQRQWSSSGNLQYTDTYTDYALISRFVSADTGQWILSIGGLGMHGTEAAGELITVPAYAKLLPRGLGRKENLQVVVRTTVINGNTGPPEVIAVQAW